MGGIPAMHRGKVKSMYKTCHHVMPSGLRCQAPAMRGYAFCYHHARRVVVRKSAPAAARFEIPARLDNQGILRGISQVLGALGRNEIAPRRASALLYGLQMAANDPDFPAPDPADPDWSSLDHLLQDSATVPDQNEAG